MITVIALRSPQKRVWGDHRIHPSLLGKHASLVPVITVITPISLSLFREQGDHGEHDRNSKTGVITVITGELLSGCAGLATPPNVEIGVITGNHGVITGAEVTHG